MNTQKTRMHDMTLKGAQQPRPTSPGVHVVSAAGELNELEPGTRPRDIYEPASSAEERQAATNQAALEPIVAVISQLDPQDSDLWTKNRGPKVSAIEAQLGQSITEAERDNAWQLFNERG